MKDSKAVSRSQRRLSELRSYLRGWADYFGLAAQLKLFDKLDQCPVFSYQGACRRIRMCCWNRWRLPRTRRRELVRLGVSRRQAARATWYAPSMYHFPLDRHR
ncbi:MAG: RNA-directed DNA polymerase [Porticoccaceae bacterium]|jgi:RNA-directed DNA polymerase